MLLNSFWAEVGGLFTQMHWAVIALLALGVVLCLIAAIVPGFGIFGILGIMCEMGAVIIHAVVSGSAVQVFFLILLVLLVTGLLFLLFIHSAKYGILAKTAIVENKSSIPKDYKEKTEKELKPLIGKEGLALTECRPVGKIRIGEEIYEAQAKGLLIQKGEVVKVVAIEDARIMIDKITY